MSQITGDTCFLLVRNLDCHTTREDLTELFKKHGNVVEICLPKNQSNEISRGFAFVRYSAKEEAQEAVNKLDGMVVDGREIVVQFAKWGQNSKPMCC